MAKQNVKAENAVAKKVKPKVKAAATKPGLVKCIVPGKALLDAVQAVKAAVNKRPAALPVLANVRIEVEPATAPGTAGRMTVTATDLTLWMRQDVVLEKFESGGVILVSATRLEALLKCFPVGDVEIAAMNDAVVAFSLGDARAELYCTPSEEWPEPPKKETEVSSSMPANDLARLLDSVAHAMSTESHRVPLCGVRLEARDGCVTAVAADGKRLSLCAQRDAVCQGVEWSATIPAKTVRAIQKGISDTRQVDLFIGKNHAEFFLEGLLITSPLLNMHYPYFETFIPSKYDVEAITQLLPLKHAVATARTLMSTLRDRVTLTFYADRVMIEVDTPEVGRYCEAVSTTAGLINEAGELDADIENHPWAITFQTSCLLDTLSAMKSSSVRLRGTYEPAPAVLLPRFDDQHGQFDSEGWREVHVIMPRRPEMTPATPQPSDGPQQSDDSDATAEMDGNAP